MSEHAQAHEGQDVGFHPPHVVPASLFFKVLLALLFLTVLTVGVSHFHFGSLNLVLAMLISAIKAALVMTFFMHLKWDTAINNIAIISSFLFLALLFLFTLSDLATRGSVDRDLLQAPDNREALLEARRNALK